jgi:hypothetical protein
MVGLLRGRADRGIAANEGRTASFPRADDRRSTMEGVPTGTPSIRRHFVRVSKAAVSKKIVSAANLPFLIVHTSSTSPLAALPFGKA